jgi:hypothetical protein
VDRNRGEVSHRWPQVLPEGRGLLYTAWTGPGDDEIHVDALLSSETEPRRLVSGGNTGRFATSGHLVYSRAGMLTAVLSGPLTKLPTRPLPL